MRIQVEFYGVARQRAQVADTRVQLPPGATLGQLLRELAAQYPEWADECMTDGRLRPQYAVNLDGHRFVRDLNLVLESQSSVLIVSADAGG